LSITHEEETEIKPFSLDQLRKEAEKQEQQLREIEDRVDSVEKKIDLLIQRMELVTRPLGQSGLEKVSLNLDRAAHRLAVIFVFLLISSAISLAFSLVWIAEILAQFSFLCIALCVVMESLHVLISRGSSKADASIPVNTVQLKKVNKKWRKT